MDEHFAICARHLLGTNDVVLSHLLNPGQGVGKLGHKNLLLRIDVIIYFELMLSFASNWCYVTLFKLFDDLKIESVKLLD